MQWSLHARLARAMAWRLLHLLLTVGPDRPVILVARAVTRLVRTSVLALGLAWGPAPPRPRRAPARRGGCFASVDTGFRRASAARRRKYGLHGIAVCELFS